MPVPVLVGSWTTIDGLVMAVPPVARTLIEAFWPGGLSLVVEHAPSLQLGPGRRQGHRDGADAAAPGRPRSAAAGRADGRVQREPQRQPAGNHRGRRRTTQLGDDVSVYLEGGESPIGVASTVVDLTVAGAAGAAPGCGEHRPAPRGHRRGEAPGLSHSRCSLRMHFGRSRHQLGRTNVRFDLCDGSTLSARALIGAGSGVCISRAMAGRGGPARNAEGPIRRRVGFGPAGSSRLGAQF